ncbi:IclR family transcriptional regulator [Niveispirillum irakense]|uniref:IclR family transcriptional regulator n=1 Tax=Niveispirillum irakense TaxID=34011 RepID=UPI00041E4B55|nr:IclR family transcriptional regulator [Niveispirillum irakense]
MDAQGDGATEEERRYRAPALEKGLDILELLARERRPLTISMMTQKLGRSMSELFRMVQVLEYRGFIQQSAGGEGYVPTDRLFSLGVERAPTRNMLEIALPVMRDLSTAIGQSCHLAVRSGSDIVVVARMESAEQIGFSVRIGHRRSMALTRSGAVLFAFQQKLVQERWLAEMAPTASAQQLNEFQKHATLVRERGFDKAASDFVQGVTDLSAPILRGEAAVAALTIPFVQTMQPVCTMDQALQHLSAAAAEISGSLLVSDNRV